VKPSKKTLEIIRDSIVVFTIADLKIFLVISRERNRKIVQEGMSGPCSSLDGPYCSSVNNLHVKQFSFHDNVFDGSVINTQYSEQTDEKKKFAQELGSAIMDLFSAQQKKHVKVSGRFEMIGSVVQKSLHLKAGKWFPNEQPEGWTTVGLRLKFSNDKKTRLNAIIVDETLEPWGQELEGCLSFSLERSEVQQNEETGLFIGQWNGEYKCFENLAKLKLTILREREDDEDSTAAFNAIFDFHTIPTKLSSSKPVPSSFTSLDEKEISQAASQITSRVLDLMQEQEIASSSSDDIIADEVTYVVAIDENGNPSVVNQIEDIDVSALGEDLAALLEGGSEQGFSLEEMLGGLVTEVEFDMVSGEFTVIESSSSSGGGGEGVEERGDKASATTTGGSDGNGDGSGSRGEK
jgi:hypothetical protein